MDAEEYLKTGLGGQRVPPPPPTLFGAVGEMVQREGKFVTLFGVTIEFEEEDAARKMHERAMARALEVVRGLRDAVEKSQRARAVRIIEAHSQFMPPSLLGELRQLLERGDG